MATKILLCDDSKTARMLMKQPIMNQNLAFVEFFDGKEAFEYVVKNKHPIDLLITDVNMPKMDGFDLIRHIRLQYNFNELPILALSGSEKSSMVAQLLKTGANDYISKPLYNEEFLTRINMALEQSRLYKENQALIEKLQAMATTDFLTKLYNRNYFFSTIKHVQAQAKRTNYQYGVIMLDIDHFKKVNDTFGHDAGDLTLVEIAKTLQEAARESDIVCRWGGEEFLILMQKSTFEELCNFARRIRLLIEKKDLVLDVDALTFHVTASIGVALGDDNIEAAISTADARLYRAKENGRNQVVCN